MDIRQVSYQRIGRRRMQTLYPNVSFQNLGSNYGVLARRLADVPINFIFPQHLPIDPRGLPFVPGGIQFFVDPELEQILGITTGMGKIALIAGQFIKEGDLTWTFNVLPPDEAPELMMLVAWAPDLPPQDAGTDSTMYQLFDGREFHRYNPVIYNGVASHGLDFWVLSNEPLVRPYLTEMARREALRLGDVSEEFMPLSPDKVKALLRHLAPLFQRSAIRVSFEPEFVKFSSGPHKWFVRYNETDAQDVVDNLFSGGFMSALHRRLPLGARTNYAAIERVFRRNVAPIPPLPHVSP